MYWDELQREIDNGNIGPGKGILKAEYLHDFVLQLWFEEDLGVSIYELDFFPLLDSPMSGSALKPLLDKQRFSQVIGRGNLAWNDPDTGEYNERAIDIAPEALKWLCEKYGKKIKG
ncbi:MAG: hypothetical protein HY080_15035 [Gammaproteobacteria bacterium]|nr:hypothetical protein [Gammaproteobacteria bacterium]